MVRYSGLTQSEAIRLAVERDYYISTLHAEEVSDLAHKYQAVLGGALSDLDRWDFIAVARALPAIVEGFLRETANEAWQDSHGHDIDRRALLEQLENLHPVDRIGILDCIDALRHQGKPIAMSRPPARRRVRSKRSA